MPKFVFDVTYTAIGENSEAALEALMNALGGVEHYDGGDVVEYVNVDGGEEVEE